MALLPSIVSGSFGTNPIQSILTHVVSVPEIAAGQSATVVVIATFTPTGGGTATITTPSGWTKFREVGVPEGSPDQILGATFYRKGPVAAADISFTFGKTALRADALVYLDKDAGRGTPEPVTVSDGQGFVFPSSPHTSAGITTPSDQCRLNFFHADLAGGAILTKPSGFASVFSQTGSSSLIGLAFSTVAKAVAGATGTIEGTGNFTNSSGALLILWASNAFLGPGDPVLLTPNGGQIIAIGQTYNVTWTLPSNGGRVAPSALVTKVELSVNNGNTWSLLTAATAAGATSYAWNTTGQLDSTQCKIRISVSDGTEFSNVIVSASTFTLFTEIAPGKPTLLSPFGQTIDRAAATLVTWTDGGAGSNPQQSYDGEWSDDGFATAGTAFSDTDTVPEHTFAGATFPAGTISVKVRTTGISLTSPYSDIKTFVAADAPSAPNLTAPTDASPPTNPDPQITWTATGQAKYRIRVIDDGLEVYNSNFIQSTTLSTKLSQITGITPYIFRNGVEVTVEITIMNAAGLTASDSKTVTPAFTGPAAPVLTVTAVDADGYLQYSVANPDTPERVEILAWTSSETEATAVSLSANIGVDGAFRDYNGRDGVVQNVKARSWDSSGLFTDSNIETITQTLSGLWIHIINPSPTLTNLYNSTLIVNLPNIEPSQPLLEVDSRQVEWGGRLQTNTHFGQHKQYVMRETVKLPNAQRAKLTKLHEIYQTARDSSLLVCGRNQLGFMVIGRLTIHAPEDHNEYILIPIEIVGSANTERVGRPA